MTTSGEMVRVSSLDGLESLYCGIFDFPWKMESAMAIPSKQSMSYLKRQSIPYRVEKPVRSDFNFQYRSFLHAIYDDGILGGLGDGQLESVDRGTSSSSSRPNSKHSLSNSSVVKS